MLFQLASGKDKHGEIISELIKACGVLRKRNIGALIVIERKTGLKDYVETGILIDGKISAEFMINLFMPRSPLHDGAVIVKDEIIRAAGCYLPLTDKEDLNKEIGTRHRAAIGITEHSDAISLVVSEETGTTSIVENGKLTMVSNEEEFYKKLKKLWEPPESPFSNLRQWKFGNGEK